MNEVNDLLRKIQKQLEELSKITDESEYIKAYQGVKQTYEKLGYIITDEFYQNESIQELDNMMAQLKNSIMPQIQISEETITNVKRVNFLNVLEKMGWPLFLVFDDDLMNELNQYQDDENISKIIFDYCDEEFINSLLEFWKSSLVIDEKRIPILNEAVALYNAGLYYGCVSVMSCQVYGIVTDTYQMQRSYGKSVPEEGKDIKSVFEHYNSNKPVPPKFINREKNQLLWFVSDAREGVLYWIKAIEYIYNTILTSDGTMNQSSHPCRNKVCHGVQLNFGTREHGLKAILTIDMMIRLAENLKRTNENQK